MSDEEINRAIAEHLGWRCQSHVPEQNKAGATMCWIPPGNHEWHPKRIPNFCSDLNAMHEAEMFMRGTLEQFHNDPVRYRMFNTYQHELMSRFGPSAEASQRAEVFLRMFGKWKENE